MKTVNFDTFAALPAGTIFSYLNHDVPEGIYRKEDTILNTEGRATDFYEIPLTPKVWNGQPPSLDGVPSRWGCGQLQEFVVYEEADLAILRALLPTSTVVPGVPASPTYEITGSAQAAALDEWGVLSGLVYWSVENRMPSHTVEYSDKARLQYHLHATEVFRRLMTGHSLVRLAELTDDQRVTLVDHLKEKFCLHCGRLFTTERNFCNCQRDE